MANSDGSTTYVSIQKTVTAIQFLFDNLKTIYAFLGYADVTYTVKSRTLAGIITDNNGNKVPINKEDWVVKATDGTITVLSNAQFIKTYTTPSE